MQQNVSNVISKNVIAVKRLLKSRNIIVRLIEFMGSVIQQWRPNLVSGGKKKGKIWGRCETSYIGSGQDRGAWKVYQFADFLQNVTLRGDLLGFRLSAQMNFNLKLSFTTGMRPFECESCHLSPSLIEQLTHLKAR